MILRAMEPLRELSFLGRLSSMVRTPCREAKMTSSGSSSFWGWSDLSVVVEYCIFFVELVGT